MAAVVIVAVTLTVGLRALLLKRKEQEQLVQQEQERQEQRPRWSGGSGGGLQSDRRRAQPLLGEQPAKHNSTGRVTVGMADAAAGSPHPANRPVPPPADTTLSAPTPLAAPPLRTARTAGAAPARRPLPPPLCSAAGRCESQSSDDEEQGLMHAGTPADLAAARLAARLKAVFRAATEGRSHATPQHNMLYADVEL